MQRNSTVSIVLAAVASALVCVATIVFSISIPTSKGFFNIGETSIYAVALLLGPYIGAAAGGLGSSLADLLLGYYYFAPATLIIKACEGGIVGFLFRKRPNFQSKGLWKGFTLGVGVVIGILVGLIGARYSGSAEITIGTSIVSLYVPSELWYFLGTLIAAIIALAGFVLEPTFGWSVFSIIVGGSVMVTGYYLYENFLLLPLFGISVLAIPEIPVNIGQMLIGLVVAIPIFRILAQTNPQLRRSIEDRPKRHTK